MLPKLPTSVTRSHSAGVLAGRQLAQQLELRHPEEARTSADDDARCDGCLEARRERERERRRGRDEARDEDVLTRVALVGEDARRDLDEAVDREVDRREEARGRGGDPEVGHQRRGADVDCQGEALDLDREPDRGHHRRDVSRRAEPPPDRHATSPNRDWTTRPWSRDRRDPGSTADRRSLYHLARAPVGSVFCWGAGKTLGSAAATAGSVPPAFRPGRAGGDRRECRRATRRR